MKIIATSKRYRCPYCDTVVELDKSDIRRWNEVYYYTCPTCHNTPHVKGGNFWCPYDIEGKKAIKL